MADYHWHRQDDDFVLVLGFDKDPTIRTACGEHLPRERITESRPT